MDRLYELAVMTPAGTLSTATQLTGMQLEDKYLVSLEIVIPTGHAGLTGIRVNRAGVQIIPFANNAFILADDEKLVIPFNDDMTATGIVVETYNLDIYDHTHYLRAMISDNAPGNAQVVQQPAPIPNDAISESGIVPSQDLTAEDAAAAAELASVETAVST